MLDARNDWDGTVDDAFWDALAYEEFPIDECPETRRLRIVAKARSLCALEGFCHSLNPDSPVFPYAIASMGILRVLS